MTKLAQIYQKACLVELEALKPGNVHIFADGHGMTVQDFIKSAAVSAPIMAQPELTVGERIYYSVKATHDAVGCNTNLGIILLCAPLMQAALRSSNQNELHASVKKVLSQLTVDDANWCAKAIVLANPAGLGQSKQSDVHQRIDATLLDMMIVAKDRDLIAKQYAQQFDTIFLWALPLYEQAMLRYQNTAWATTALYLAWLARQPDSHIVRKYGEIVANKINKDAIKIQTTYNNEDNPKNAQKLLMDWDGDLKEQGLNPGACADLTVATLFTILYALKC